MKAKVHRVSFALISILLVFFATIIVAGIGVYQYQKSPTGAVSTPQTLIQDNPAKETASDNSLVVDPNQDNRAKIYPKPTAPMNLEVTPSGSGYKLAWESSQALGSITRYQVYYQGNLIAEPTATSYQHNLPPPPPGCQPISLTYFVRAIDNEESFSPSSNSVTVQFGGC